MTPSFNTWLADLAFPTEAPFLAKGGCASTLTMSCVARLCAFLPPVPNLALSSPWTSPTTLIPFLPFLSFFPLPPSSSHFPPFGAPRAPSRAHVLCYGCPSATPRPKPIMTRPKKAPVPASPPSFAASSLFGSPRHCLHARFSSPQPRTACPSPPFMSDAKANSRLLGDKCAAWRPCRPPAASFVPYDGFSIALC
jgi:hypothetical protein